MTETTTYIKIATMIDHLLALIWEQGQVIRQHGPAGGKAIVFHAQAITELAKGVRELGYALEYCYVNTDEPEPADDQPDKPQMEPVEWDQEQGEKADDTIG